MKILLVEDDLEQLESLGKILSQAGHIVECVADATTAQWLISDRDYDLLILDWMLPEVSGIHICSQYRQMGKSAPVMIITDKDSTEDKIAGLDAGADDLLVKPFNSLDLLARVRALSRRAPIWQGNSLTIGDLKLHLDTFYVEHQQKKALLTTREFHLLEYMLRHPRQVLKKQQIERALWEWDNEPESNAVNSLVHRLRQRLKQVDAADWLQTIYGEGYRLCNPKGSFNKISTFNSRNYEVV